MRIRTLLSTLGTLTTFGLHAGCGYDGIWDINYGYRHDSLHWSIAGQEGTPNYFATLDWPDIHTFQVGTRYILAGWDSIYFRTEGYFGWVCQAENIYQVFLGENKTDLFSREVACRTGDKLYGAKAGLGIHLLRECGPFDLAAIVGYSFQGLRLRWRDPKLVYSQSQFPGSVDTLIAKYRPKWNGGFVGLDGFLHWGTCLTFSGTYEVHWTTYRAHGIWNWTQPPDMIIGIIPPTPPMFYRQEWKDCATAWGHVFSGSLTYNSEENWYLGIFANTQYFRSRGCDYDVYTFSDNSLPDLIYIVTLPNNTDNLNPVTWINYYVSFVIECRF